MDKRFLSMLAICAVVLGGIYFVAHKPAKTTDTTPKGAVSNHVIGAGNKGVELIEFGDYQCPACGGFYPILKQIIAKYGDDIKFVFRNFPLDQLHQNARAAHRAAEAADMQNKYWEMHDMLYEQQQSWSTASNPTAIFESYAQQLGLNVTKFKADAASDKVNKIINADIAAGQGFKATSTPTFVLDGKTIDSETQTTIRTVEGFSKLLDTEIAKKASTVKPATGETPAPAAPTAQPTVSEPPAQPPN